MNNLHRDYIAHYVCAMLCCNKKGPYPPKHILLYFHSVKIFYALLMVYSRLFLVRHIECVTNIRFGDKKFNFYNTYLITCYLWYSSILRKVTKCLFLLVLLLPTD